MTTQPLLVLDASAGSGKTYSLVRQYLRLLLNSEKPVDISAIVAMTFTNKAATEMKTRILRDLHQLAWMPEEYGAEVNSMATLCQSTPEELIQNARTTLTRLLHSYENFHVLTIDKFNLRLIRSFSRDLDLPELFEITLDENAVLEKAVDDLLSGITNDQANRLAHLALSFATESQEEEGNWDLRKAIIAKGSILSSEKFTREVQQLLEQDFSPEICNLWKIQLNDILQESDRLRRNLKTAYEPYANAFNKGGMLNAGKKIVQLIENRIDSKNDGFSKYQNSHLAQAYEKSPATGFDVSVLKAVDDFLRANIPVVQRLKLYISEFYVMAFLRELALGMEQIRNTQGIIRISEFNKLISNLVQREDAPYIYERLGTRYRHYFLDEFQDTSRLQWLNLVPLVHESLASNNFNLIVGDPKQSIYRFKNGVAEQFVKLPEIYNPEEIPAIQERSAFFGQSGKKEPLLDNWRSAAEIVEFNNELFTRLAAAKSEVAGNFYTSIRQTPKGKPGGLITFALCTEDMNAPEYVDQEIIRILGWVNECLEGGYNPYDICILVRRKKHGSKIASALRQEGFAVVSSDSLLLGADIAVNAVMALLEWKHYHGNPKYAKRFADLWLRQHEADSMEQFQQLMVKDEQSRMLMSVDAIEAKIPGISELLHVPFQDLYSLLKIVYRRLSFNENENPWLFQLLDVAAEFDKANGPDLKAFLEFFDRRKDSINVQTPEQENAVRIMTVHKSKGLEFPVVIYANLTAKNNDNTRLLLPMEDRVQHVALKKNTKIEELAKEYQIEESARYLDQLNELYVALTRPTDRLYFVARNAVELSQSLIECLADMYPEFESKSGVEGSIGKPPEMSHASIDADNPFRPSDLTDTLWFPEISLMTREEDDATALNRQKRLGTRLHGLLEKSDDQSSATELLQIGVRAGNIEAEFEQELKDWINQVYSNEQYLNLLSQGDQLNERTLLLDPEMRLRPDKMIVKDDAVIVVDYKTGEALAEHRQQVSNYLFALREIGFRQVSGYLFYLQNNALERVSDDLFS